MVKKTNNKGSKSTKTKSTKTDGVYQIDSKVWDGKILGTPTKWNKLYLVNWYYVANFGSYMVWAKNEYEAYNSCLYSRNKKVRFQITKVNPNSLPMLFNYGSRKGDF